MARATEARRCALALLGERRRRDARARDLLRGASELERLSERDRGFVTRLVMGVTSAQGELDRVIESHLRRGAKLEPRVRDALRLAAFELLYLGARPDAAVSQGVELVRGVAPRAAGLANAVLRRVAEKDAATLVASRARVANGSFTTSDLARVGGGQNHLLHAVPARGNGNGQRAAHRAQRAVQRQLAEDGGIGNGSGVHLARAGQNADGDRQVERGAFLFQIRRRKVYRDAVARKGVAAVLQRRADALARLLHRGVGQTHDVKHRKPGGKVHLHRDLNALNAAQSVAKRGCQHAVIPLSLLLQREVVPVKPAELQRV